MNDRRPRALREREIRLRDSGRLIGFVHENEPEDDEAPESRAPAEVVSLDLRRAAKPEGTE